MARFVAEFTSTKSKLLKRIEYLELEMNKYDGLDDQTESHY